MRALYAFFICAVIVLFSPLASAQDQTGLKGQIIKTDEAAGTITLTPQQTGTSGSAGPASSETFKVQDGLAFNAVQPGDQIIYSVTIKDGQKTLTKIEKQ